MNNDCAEIIIYHNNSYAQYGNCYLIYCKDNGCYILGEEDWFKVMQSNLLGDITCTNIDEFAASRKFNKVIQSNYLTCDENKVDIQWFNTDHEDLKNRLITLKGDIVHCARDVFQSDSSLTHLYGSLNILLKYL